MYIRGRHTVVRYTIQDYKGLPFITLFIIDKFEPELPTLPSSLSLVCVPPIKHLYTVVSRRHIFTTTSGTLYPHHTFSDPFTIRLTLQPPINICLTHNCFLEATISTRQRHTD